jgi:hypothetical protein
MHALKENKLQQTSIETPNKPNRFPRGENGAKSKRE